MIDEFIGICLSEMSGDIDVVFSLVLWPLLKSNQSSCIKFWSKLAKDWICIIMCKLAVSMQKSASESAFVTFAPDFKLDVIKTIFKVLNIDTSCPSKPLKVLMFFSYRKVSHVSQKICEHCSLFAGLLHALVVSCLFVFVCVFGWWELLIDLLGSSSSWKWCWCYQIRAAL